jgi:hypothetical protein
MTSSHRTFLVSMTLFWLAFGLGTTFYPQMMQLFMTPEGIAASTAFSDHVWLHDGLDILSVCLLLFALSRLPVTRATLRLVAIVGLLPTAGIVNSLLTTPYWRPIFLVPAIGCFAFVVWGFVLSRSAPITAPTESLNTRAAS